jgi:hypothetical protein
MGVSKMAKRKRYADYMRAIVDADAKWVTDSFARDRRICLWQIRQFTRVREEALSGQ